MDMTVFRRHRAGKGAGTPTPIFCAEGGGGWMVEELVSCWQCDFSEMTGTGPVARLHCEGERRRCAHMSSAPAVCGRHIALSFNQNATPQSSTMLGTSLQTMPYHAMRCYAAQISMHVIPRHSGLWHCLVPHSLHTKPCQVTVHNLPLHTMQ